ncbi:hypothetical protein [Ruminococcus sp.]
MEQMVAEVEQRSGRVTAKAKGKAIRIPARAGVITEAVSLCKLYG